MGRKIEALRWAATNKPNVKGMDLFYQLGLNKSYNRDSGKLAFWGIMILVYSVMISTLLGISAWGGLIIGIVPALIFVRAGNLLDNVDRQRKLDEYVRKMRVNAS